MGKVVLDKTGASHLLLMVLVSKVFTPEMRMLPTTVGSSAWLVMLLAGIPSLIGFWLLLTLLKRFPGESLVTISRQVLGRYGGTLVLFAYTLYFTTLTGLSAREFTTGFHITVMPHTPISAFLMILLGVALYAAFKGPESLTRMAAYLLPVLFLLLMLIVLGTVRHFELISLFPIFGLGMGRTLLSSIPLSSMYAEIVALGVLAGFLRPEHISSIGWRVMIGGILALSMAWLILIIVFPYPGVTHLFFPMLDLARLVEVSEFLQRLEALFVFLWFFVAAFKLALTFLCMTLLYSGLAGLSDYRPLLAPMGLVVYASAFLPHDVVSAVIQAFQFRSWVSIIAYVLPALTLLVAVIRKKRGKNDEAVQTNS